MNKFSNVAGYEVNTQNSVAFLYINNEWSEKEMRKFFWIYNSIKNNTKLRNYFNEEETQWNYNTPPEEIKDNMNKRKRTSRPWGGGPDSVTISILPRVVHTVSAIPIKIPGAPSAEIQKPILKFRRTCKGSGLAQTALKDRD